ncbi:MAG: undecaprenyldiphospho-muramoylpentapeptide beta-N-acetylglucosaminyltransferase [Bacteroidales bacterium]|nr:undecaprenyldiphospho-muramoylpentapeptide beta-N-acetylglucosaminyltransferase [Bacteroidales bacterium]
MKVIISGGGTGGHIFPAISIANALREIDPSTEILFVGAKGKMEMEKVPAAGYEIVGLPVAGFHRKINLRNICRNMLFPFRLLGSMITARRVLKRFNPDVCVGVGGYASGPVLRCASQKGIPCLLQEQNSYPGVTNKILAAKAKRICVAYPDMERFFPKEKITFTGNPVRQSLQGAIDREEAAKFFGLDPNQSIILVIGGSLGARSINNGISATLDDLQPGVQLLWQTGKMYYADIQQKLKEQPRANVHAYDFIKRMDYAYAIADVVISRAGASSISELALLGKPCIFVPSPNVAEDHQTKNAMALVSREAARLVRDSETRTLLAEAQLTVSDKEQLEKLATNIRQFAKPNAAADIAKYVFELGGKK